MWSIIVRLELVLVLAILNNLAIAYIFD
jgi:hypothetical protein